MAALFAGPTSKNVHLQTAWAIFGKQGRVISRKHRSFSLGLWMENMTITAKYENGVFKPLEDVNINEGTIVEVHVPSYADPLKAKSRDVRDFAFYGMWKDRDEMADSVEYINRLRRDLRG